jgi:PAS domain S-box-containing protein
MPGQEYRVFRYTFSETDAVRIIVIASLVVSCTVITAISFSRSIPLVNYQLFFIPILYATYFYAKRGLLLAGFCGIVYQAIGYYYRYPDPAALMGVTSEAFLFVIVAGLLSYFVDRVRAGEAQYRQLTERSPTSILVLREGQIMFANPAFCAFSEYLPEDLVGKDLIFLLDSRDRDRFGEFRSRTVSENQLADGTEFRFVTRSGGIRVALVFASPILHDGRPATMMNLVDISVQQRLEEKIQQDNERRRGIIITVAHELRTPLQPILGYLNLLIQDPQGFGIMDDTKKMLERCLVSVERERQIINQMLELSVLDSGKLRLTFTRFSLAALVRSVLDTCGYLGKGDVTVDIPDDLYLVADRDRLYSVLDSLLSNAVNYSKPPRKIRIAYRPGQDGKSHAITVKDNGIGIPASLFASIFEPFQLADAAKLSRKYDRLGLSLSIAKKIMQMHGGDITVESTVNVGSAFTIHLPGDLLEDDAHVA